MKGDVPTKKKVPFKIKGELLEFIKKYNRLRDMPIDYSDLLRIQTSTSLLDHHGNETLWETCYYSESDRIEIDIALRKIYAYLKTDGDHEAIDHLVITRIDYCTFGNTKPFRIRIKNQINDNYDHFYVKQSDSSRVYGLELEYLLSPNNVNYFCNEETLVEEHVIGVPGDEFIAQHLDASSFNQTRIVKEFVKFNERCFVRLLGDMRAYNYVVKMTPDIEGYQYRIRAIDFDQQSYEGKMSFYLPQYFKENNPIIFVGIKKMNTESLLQYQLEERSLIAKRLISDRVRARHLLDAMCSDNISTPKKVKSLREQLAKHHKNDAFLTCKNMGEIVRKNIELVLDKDFIQGI